MVDKGALALSRRGGATNFVVRRMRMMSRGSRVSSSSTTRIAVRRQLLFIPAQREIRTCAVILSKAKDLASLVSSGFFTRDSSSFVACAPQDDKERSPDHHLSNSERSRSSRNARATPFKDQPRARRAVQQMQNAPPASGAGGASVLEPYWERAAAPMERSLLDQSLHHGNAPSDR